MKKTFFIILLAILFLGCTLPIQTNGGDDNDEANTTYKVIGIDSFYSDVNEVSAGGITNVKLAVTNYGDDAARNIYAKLLGHEGQDIEISNEYISTQELIPESSTEFYWPMQMPDLPIETDVGYVLDARVYYDYSTRASKEVVFVSGTESSSVTPSGSCTEAPVGLSLTSINPIHMNPDEAETEFTVTLRIQNIGQGYVGYIDGDGNEINEKNNYLDSIAISVPSSWEPLHGEDWTVVASDQCACPEGYDDEGDSCEDCLCTQCYKVGDECSYIPCPEGSVPGCDQGKPVCTTDVDLFVAPSNIVSHDFCPSDYVASCTSSTDISCTRSFSPGCPEGDRTIMALDFDEGDQDTRMRLVRGDHVTYSIGFIRENVDVETVENIRVLANYSYYIPTKNSVDITVRGEQQTY